MAQDQVAALRLLADLVENYIRRSTPSQTNPLEDWTRLRQEQPGGDDARRVDNKAPPAPNPAPVAEAPTYTMGKLLALTGYSHTRLSHYEKLAGVSMPSVGGRNHRWTQDEVEKILRAIIDGSGDRRKLAHCQKSLDSITNPKEIT